MSTPGKPRQSGIPTPGKPGGIPTPGRSRSSSSATAPQHGGHTPDVEYMSRAFADALKANDPAHHRTSDISTASLSPQSVVSSSHSGRRSVTGRPSSVASSSSAVSSTQERVKTPARPPSRHSDLFGRSASRAGRTFEVGDNVRIESLGYEGTLRYMGEIQGKLGMFAGVELSGGFAGKGKNNGTVNGKQYFSCPTNCGVFIATTKLSPPTVGVGAVRRPSSVASSRGGRATPSISGRITPSTSTSIPNGRTTPLTSISNGRITPSRSTGRATPGTTPAARARLRTLAKSTNTPNPGSSSLTDKITAGSRASKYVSMTAKQLSSRDAGISTPARSIPSPAQTSLFTTSPTRPIASPFSTPKPGLGGRVSNVGGIPSTTPIKGRPSLNTPRPRIPSAIAMPPPASPSASSSSRSISLNDPALHHDKPDAGSPLTDLEHHGRVLQDKIAQLMSGKSSSTRGHGSPRPDSAASIRSSTADERAHIEQLQSRVDALEYENDRLRSAPNTSDSDYDIQLRVSALQLERDEARSRISLLQAELKTAEASLDDRDSRLQSLDRDHQQTLAALENEKHESEIRFKVLQLKLDDSTVLVKSLKEAVKVKERAELENDSSLKAKNAHIASLESRMEKAYAELEEERKELGGQVDELRQAGQETIALYEERLSAADSERYELEDRIASLEAGVGRGLRTPSPMSASQTFSATQIDNETLRDQVHHLQRKVATMEDILEDAHATSEKEEAVLRERMKRLKDKEEAMKKELNEGRKEVERMFKSEVSARSRVEEIEEALRESTVALENARAEVEILRAELTNLDGLVASSSAGDLSARVAEVAQRASTDRARFNEEIVKLQHLLDESRANEQQATKTLKLGGYKDHADKTSLHDLQEALKNLQAKNDHLVQIKEDQEDHLVTLRQSLTDRSAELDSLKKVNRDIPVHGGLQESFRPAPQSPSSKYELTAAREEITGLKHIVQELQKENLAATQRNKLLDSENQLLLSETDQLRQEVKIFEESLDQSLNREEQALEDYPPNAESVDIESLPRVLKEQKQRFETDLEQLRKRLADAEMKNARTTHDLNKEISELEALVESKIYREDELEQELERLKDKLARQKKSSKNSTESMEPRHRFSTTSGSTASDTSHQEVCEICERPGHDIFNCDLLKEDITTIPKHQPVDTKTSQDLFCEDCESHGHLAADCPHSLEVF